MQSNTHYKTRAFEFARKEGWTLSELARRSGLSTAMVYSLHIGRVGIGAKAIAGFRRAFPDHSFEALFQVVDETPTQRSQRDKKAVA